MFLQATLSLVGLVLCLSILGTAFLFRLLVETILLIDFLVSPRHRQHTAQRHKGLKYF